MADIFSVIADPTRRHVLSVLLERYVGSDDPATHAGGEGVDASAKVSGATSAAASIDLAPPMGEVSVSELVSLLELSQPTVSKHLKVLRDAGLVSVREDGQHRYYALEASPLEEIEDWLIPFLSADFDDVVELMLDDAKSPAAQAGERVGQSVADATGRVKSLFEGAVRRFPNIARSSD